MDTLKLDVQYRAIAEINEQARVKMNALRAESDAHNAKVIKAAQQAAWGALPGETLSYRSALTDLEKVTDVWQLQQKLSQAIETGDRTLSKAIAYTAAKIPGGQHVLDDYRESYPDVGEALDNIDAAQSMNGGQAGGEALHLFAFALPTF